MKISRKLAWTVTPLVAAALSVGGIAIASNAWHTSQHITASGNTGTVLPVIATATIEDVYPGQPIVMDLHFDNPNNFPVTVLSLQATTVHFTYASNYPDPLGNNGVAEASTLNRSYDGPACTTSGGGCEWDVTGDPTGPGSLSLPATAFDLGPTAAVAPGTSDQQITSAAVDASFGDPLQQGTPISIDYFVDEAAF